MPEPNTALPMIDSSVSFSETVGLRRWASTEMPKNVAPRIVAIHIKVWAAFFGSGLRNAGHAVGDRLDAGERDGA